MPPPLLETKLRAPGPRPGMVARPGLTALLERSVAAHRLTLVSAAAGWGKSTLVGEWLAARERPVAWLALDVADNDPARFWRYLSEALQRAGVPLDDQAAGALAGSPEMRETGLSLLLGAVPAGGAPTIVTLDDVHAITEPSILTALAFLVDHLPESLRIVMTSRNDPPIGLARLRARGDLGEIRSDALRFSDDDAAVLLRGAVGVDLPAGQVAALRTRTEGWAAGLYLAGLSLRGRDDAGAFIADFAGDDRLVVDYLAAEVLEGQTPERREFLLRTAILGRLSGPLCDAVAGTRDAARVLAELERSNLFLVPLDNRREWYRYHHLFGELLRHELTLVAPDTVAALHRRAAAWYLGAGSIDEAVRHSAAGGDLEGAADLIAENWIGYERSGWTMTTESWLALLPPERVRSDPRLCMAEALIRLNLGRPDEATPWLDDADAAMSVPGAPGDHEAMAGGLASARSLVRLLAGDTPGGVAEGRRAMEITPAGATWWRTLACMALGIALHAAGGAEEAYPILEEAAACGGACGATALVVVSLSHLADTDFRRGDTDLAEERSRRAIALAEDERHSEYPHAAGAHVNLARVLAARGEHEEARAQADRGVLLARRGRAPTELAHAVTVRGEVYLAAGDEDEARACAREARQLTAPARGVGHIRSLLDDLEASLRTDAAAEVPPADPGELTERELAVLRRLTGDGSAREIAADLYVSHNTVKTQMRAIYRKLGVATREDAVRQARERGLLSPQLRSGGV
ncbi:MAG: helix-turn-helix transcriptional regulator [Thermoleophilia bacterium]|nr:helix-turn-helix transcriptional regulator [Thermoleophilia bacterium]